VNTPPASPLVAGVSPSTSPPVINIWAQRMQASKPVCIQRAYRLLDTWSQPSQKATVFVFQAIGCDAESKKSCSSAVSEYDFPDLSTSVRAQHDGSVPSHDWVPVAPSSLSATGSSDRLAGVDSLKFYEGTYVVSKTDVFSMEPQPVAAGDGDWMLL